VYDYIAYRDKKVVGQSCCVFHCAASERTAARRVRASNGVVLITTKRKKEKLQ
jgi:hypothetical protein